MIEFELRTFELSTIDLEVGRGKRKLVEKHKKRERSCPNGPKPDSEQPEKAEHLKTSISTGHSRGIRENHQKMQKRKTSIFITHKS